MLKLTAVCIDLQPVFPYVKAQWPWSLFQEGDAIVTGFDDRKEAFEKRFAHDAELRFKAEARRNKLLGLWAAEKMGLAGAEASTYAQEVIKADFEEAGDEDVFRKIRKDFDAGKIEQSDHQIRQMMSELMGKAIEQIQAGV